MVVFTYNAAVSACVKGRQHWQAVLLLRAVQRLVVVLSVFEYAAAARSRGGVSSTSGSYISCEQYGAMPSGRCHPHDGALVWA